MTTKYTLTALLAASIGANALSTGCTTQIGSLALSSNLSQCLQLGSVLPLFTGNSNSSIVSKVDDYLGSLCSSSTPQCSNETLSSSQDSISSSCSQDLQNGGTEAVEVMALQELLKNYDHVYAAACSKNQTTGDFCITQTLGTVQNDTNTQITVSFLTSLLSGSGDGMQTLQQEFESGKLCTGCVQGIYQQALQANASIANSPIGSALTQTCGADFASSSATPSGLQVGNPSNAASSGASANTSGAADKALSLVSTSVVVGGVGMMLAAVIGGSLVL